MRHPLLQDVTLETVVDYTVDFMRIVGVPSMFEEKIEYVTIKEYRALLPCDYYQMNQIRLIDSNGNPRGVFRYSTDSFHMGNTVPDFSDLTYKVQGSVIHTSLQEGAIEIAYQAITVDDMGYPLIPDNSSFTRALEGYIKKQWFTILFDLGKLNINILNQALQDYSWAVGDCQTEFNRMSLDKAESFFNSWKTLLIRSSEHKSGFAYNGSQEKLKTK